MMSSTGIQDAVKILSPERRALLAAWLEQKGGAGPAPRLSPIVKAQRQGELPLSFAQRRLWFLDQLNPGMTTYNVPAPIYLKGSLDVAALEKSIREIIRRHDSLRTTFPNVEGRPVQAISPDC